MLETAIALIVGFALGYGVREWLSRRRRQAENLKRARISYRLREVVDCRATFIAVPKRADPRIHPQAAQCGPPRAAAVALLRGGSGRLRDLRLA